MKNLIHLLKKVMCYTIIFVYVAKDSKATNVIITAKNSWLILECVACQFYPLVDICALNYKVSFMCCLSLYAFDQMHGTKCSFTNSVIC